MECQEEENSPMRDMTEDEQAEYHRILDTLYKPTGLNLFDFLDDEDEQDVGL